MTPRQAAVLARRAWLEQQEHKRQQFLRHLVCRGLVSDWPGEVDRLFLPLHFPLRVKRP